MKADTLLNAIGKIDSEYIMKADLVKNGEDTGTGSVVAESAVARTQAHAQVRPAKHQWIRYAAIATAAVALAIVGVAIYFNMRPIEEPEPSETYSTIVVTPTGIDPNETLAPGGLTGDGGKLDFVIDTSPVSIIGTGYSLDEVTDLISNDKQIIGMTVAAETGCFGEELRIYLDGFSIVSLGDENVLDRDYASLPICKGTRVIGFVDLFKVDDEIHYSISAGGTSWDAINAALEYGEVAFAYVGFGEVAIAEDNRVFEITEGISDLLPAEKDWFSVIRTDMNTYSAANFDPNGPIDYNAIMDSVDADDSLSEYSPYISVVPVKEDINLESNPNVGAGVFEPYLPADDEVIADYIEKCRALIPEGELETVTNYDSPRVLYRSMPEEMCYFRIVDEDYVIQTGDDGYCYSVTFTTTADPVLGPIEYYIDVSGTIFGSAYRE